MAGRRSGARWPNVRNDKRGYVAPQKTGLIRFQGTEYDGLEIRCRMQVSMALYLELVGLQDLAASSQQPNDQSQTAQAMQAAEKALHCLGDQVLRDWNLVTEAGEPIPSTGDGMMQLDLDFAMLILGQW